MATKRHKVLNLLLILFPWLTMLFIGKRSLKRYSISGVFIIIFEIINHLYGHHKKWWTFYDKRKSSFIRDELPFDLGPYMPMSLWILKYSYGNLKKYALINAIANGLFSFIGIPILKKVRIVELKRINYLQFFIYIHYKAYILYGVQYLLEKIKRDKSALDN
jgi:hypothetical protein